MWLEREEASATMEKSRARVVRGGGVMSDAVAAYGRGPWSRRNVGAIEEDFGSVKERE